MADHGFMMSLMSAPGAEKVKAETPLEFKILGVLEGYLTPTEIANLKAHWATTIHTESGRDLMTEMIAKAEAHRLPPPDEWKLTPPEEIDVIFSQMANTLFYNLLRGGNSPRLVEEVLHLTGCDKLKQLNNIVNDEIGMSRDMISGLLKAAMNMCANVLVFLKYFD